MTNLACFGQALSLDSADQMRILVPTALIRSEGAGGTLLFHYRPVLNVFHLTQSRMRALTISSSKVSPFNTTREIINSLIVIQRNLIHVFDIEKAERCHDGTDVLHLVLKADFGMSDSLESQPEDTRQFGRNLITL